MKVEYKQVMWCMTIALLAVAMIALMPNINAAIMFLVYATIFSWALLEPRKNVYFILFLTSFFAFLLGRPMITEFGGQDTAFYFVAIPANISQYSYGVMTLSMVSIFAGYANPVRIRFSGKSLESYDWISSTTVSRIRVLSRTSTMVLGLLQLIDVVERILFVAVFGYMESYLRQSSTLPYFLLQLVELFPISFALFLSTLPSKKETRWPIALYLLIMSLNLLTGKRYETVSAAMFILLYCTMRNKTDSEQWIKKKHVVAAALAVPFLLILLMAVESWRLGANVSKSFMELIEDFFVSVGGSSVLISYEKMYHDTLVARNAMFSFGNIWNSLNGNIIAQFLGAEPVYKVQTVENALYGHSLGAALMYYISPTRYLNGGGLGSCYIAELMCDFSYPGMILGSCFIGWVIKRCNSLVNGSFLHNFLVVFMAVSMFRIPRDSFDFFLYQFVGIKNILFFLVVLVIAKSKLFWKAKS